jgi:beta-N-acetylhexosaminidase
MITGQIMLDLQGTELSAEEIEMLHHPNTGGVILFSRNYLNPSQLHALTKQIHSIREPRLLIGVDHEGGRVQRFKDQFTCLPPCRMFGDLYDHNKNKSLNTAELSGWLMASELLSLGIDFSFAPVLDLDFGISQVIGDRAFHSDPDVVTEIAQAFIKGMSTAGMSAVGKHFPGHGHVKADSHVDIPVDAREYEDILVSDILPFEKIISAGIEGIMPAHVIYPNIDEVPAGFSPIWLGQILRKKLGFQGVIFSDDINMEGAKVAGGPLQRAVTAIDAGCDMILVCNNRTATMEILDNLNIDQKLATNARINRMYGKYPDFTFVELQRQQKWKDASKKLSNFIYLSE